MKRSKSNQDRGGLPRNQTALASKNEQGMENSAKKSGEVIARKGGDETQGRWGEPQIQTRRIGNKTVFPAGREGQGKNGGSAKKSEIAR